MKEDISGGVGGSDPSNLLPVCVMEHGGDNRQKEEAWAVGNRKHPLFIVFGKQFVLLFSFLFDRTHSAKRLFFFFCRSFLISILSSSVIVITAVQGRI